MDLRVFTEPHQGASYEDLLRIAKPTEDLGFDAFFRSDHYLAMASDGLPGPTDAWLTLAALARVPSRLRLGTLVILDGSAKKRSAKKRSAKKRSAAWGARFG